MEFKCEFNSPRNLGTEAEPDWEYRELTCSGTSTDETLIFTIENPTSSVGNFVISKSYTYGDIATLLLQGLIFFLILFFAIKRSIVKPEIEVSSKEHF